MLPNLVNFQFYRRFGLRIYGNNRLFFGLFPRRGEEPRKRFRETHFNYAPPSPNVSPTFLTIGRVYDSSTRAQLNKSRVERNI